MYRAKVFVVHVLRALVCAALVAGVLPLAEGAEQQYLVGAAKIDVTPQHPTLLAGYGSRTEEHVAVETKIWARALALGDREASLVIAVDNCGIPAPLVKQVADKLLAARGLPAERLVVAATHTHNAPTLPGYAPFLWQGRTTDAQWERTERYSAWLVERLVEVGCAALDARRPATLAWGQGRVTFGGNRRVLESGRWVGFGHMETGPVDHSLPILVARDADDRIIAIWVNYACHCTTLGDRNTVGGDWAGFSNEYIEAAFPQTIALTTIGCGADVGPQPTGNEQFTRAHGREIADEVQRLVGQKLSPITQPLRVSRRAIKLPLDKPPTREEFEQRSRGQGFEAEHARHMLKLLDETGTLPDHVPYTISTWRFGDELGIVFLAGEVTVDYAVRLKSELDWTRLWINGWSNDIPCYIPSRRLLGEGGYETDFSMIFYGHPTRFAPEVEEVLVSAVKEELGETFLAGPATPMPTWFAPPDGRELFSKRLHTWLQERDESERAVLADVAQLVSSSREGFARLLDPDIPTDRWYHYSGRIGKSHTLRQEVAGKSLRWQTAPAGDVGTRQVFVFLGGLGWKSQPATEGFSLAVNGRERLDFDISTRAETWQSADGSARLYYVPTWRNEEDSAGLFVLVLSEGDFAPGEPCELSVTSRGSGSQRWFGLHPITDAKSVVQLLVKATTEHDATSPKTE